jgi:hypothetical protein
MLKAYRRVALDTNWYFGASMKCQYPHTAKPPVIADSISSVTIRFLYFLLRMVILRRQRVSINIDSLRQKLLFYPS